ncbi:MAG TPA: hypothetical protein VFP58_12165 [Candidatus Eisenbacteria bacterium]|nr:hypothetical protein [Candidatus Eisenbacteria bacterium]
MSGYLGQLALRATGGAPSLSPRVPGWFETSPTMDAQDVPLEPPPARAAVGEPREVVREVLRTIEVHLPAPPAFASPTVTKAPVTGREIEPRSSRPRLEPPMIAPVPDAPRIERVLERERPKRERIVASPELAHETHEPSRVEVDAHARPAPRSQLRPERAELPRPSMVLSAAQVSAPAKSAVESSSIPPPQSRRPRRARVEPPVVVPRGPRPVWEAPTPVDPGPAVHVAIGRIEVRAVPTPSPRQAPAARPAVVPLEDYLRGGRR